MSKQTKALLKITKQLLQEKKYDEALEQCKNLLTLDPNNYNGLVFNGLCLAELHQKENSRAVYHEAIKLNRDQVLAYQGLVNLYTKHWVAKLNPDDTADLILAYEHLIKLMGSQGTKKAELQLGLAKAYCSVEKFSQCLSTLEQAIELVNLFENGEGDTNPNLNSYYEEALTSFRRSLNVYKDLQNFSKLFSDTVKNTFNCNDDSYDCEEIVKLFIVFNQSKDGDVSENIEILVSTIRWLLDKNWKSSLLAQCLLEIHLQDETLIGEDTLANYVESLSDVGDSVATAYQGYKAFSEGRFEICAELLQKSCRVFPEFLPSRLHLAKALLKLHKWDSAEKITRSALQDCKRLANSKLSVPSSWLIRITSLSSLKLDFTFAFAQALSESDNTEMLRLAIGTFEQLSKIWSNSTDVFMGKAKVYIKLKEYDSANSALNLVEKFDGPIAEVKSWRAFIISENGDRETAVNKLQEIVNENPDCFIAHLLLGKILWQGGASLQNKAFTLFLKAAKLNVYHGFSFYYIGLYYRDVAQNSSKATRCFEKAYNLGPKNEEIGSALADQYVEEGNLAAAISLYESVTSVASAGSCKWAWLRLGLCRLKNNDMEPAIKCLQAALRCDVDDYISWECLGEAYLHRGSYTSAWKAFNKAHDLAPNSVYSLYQMAAIKQVLNQYADAVLEYEEVLQLSQEYIPALKGIGESHLSLGKIMLTEGRYLTCVDHINKAVKYLASAAVARPDLSCVWKLLGDCMTIIHPLDGSKVSIAIPFLLLNKEENLCEDKIVSKLQALQLGGKFYAQALRLHNSALLWRDFALNCFCQAQENEQDNGMASKALQMLQKGLSLEPTNHTLWNALGSVAASKYIKEYALAQHSFIRSIQCEPNNVEAWSNLGVFYLERSQIELAHKAFKTAQSLEPSYVNSWIGQAIIAESIGSPEAMDLFRHATALSLHGQASVGYATWVCDVLSESQHFRQTMKYKENIQDLCALSAATAQLSKFCDCNPHCVWAFAMYGYLLEESELNQSAEEAYEHCLNLLTSQLRHGSDSDGLTAKIEKTQKDYARILCKNRKYQKAVEVYQSLGGAINDYKSSCEYALVLFSAGLLDDVYLALCQASEIATSQRERILVDIATAVLSWKRGNKTDAVEILSRQKSNSSDVQLSLLAIGVLENDLALIQSLLCDVIKHDVTSNKPYDVMYRNCVVITAALAKLDSKTAICYAQKWIHKRPDDYRFRQLLSSVLNRSDIFLSSLSAEQSRLNYLNDVRTLPIEAHHNMMGLNSCTKRHCDMYANRTASLLATGKLKGQGDNALKSAQRLMHRHPYFAESLSLLSSACYASNVLSRFTESDERNSLSLVSCNLLNAAINQSSDLHAWALKQNKLSRLFSCNVDENDLPPEISWHFFLSKDLFQQAYSALSKVRSTSDCVIKKLKLSVCMSYVALQAARSEPNKEADWLNRARSILEDGGKSPIVQLLQGLVHHQLKSYKKAITYLSKVFSNTSLSSHCQSRNIAAWYLYRIYHVKDDDMQIKKLLEKWKKLSDNDMQKITRLLPYS